MMSDRIGRKPFVLAGSIGLFVLAIPAFMLINSGVIGLIFLGLLILAVLLNCFTGVMASILPAIFPTKIRYSALAISFNISVLIAGATPTAAAWLVEATNNLYMPAYYLMVIAVIGMITAIVMKKPPISHYAAPHRPHLTARKPKRFCSSITIISNTRLRRLMRRLPRCRNAVSH